MEPSGDALAGPNPAVAGAAQRGALAEPGVGPVLTSWLEVLVAEGLILGAPREWRGRQGGESAPKL